MERSIISLFLVMACSSPATVSRCTPGQVVECACGVGVRGVQTCAISGDFNVCTCIDAGSGDAPDIMFDTGTDAATVEIADISTEAAVEAGRPTCGNGILDVNEACDPVLFGIRECSLLSYEFVGGSARCSERCQFDLSMCRSRQSVCGNGRIEVGENCDDGNTDSGDGCSRGCRTERVTRLEPTAEIGETVPGAVYGSSACAITSTRSSYHSDRTQLTVSVAPIICRVGMPATNVVSEADVRAQIARLNTIYSSAQL